MSDIGSDSDATIADSIEEGDIEEDVIEEDVIGEKDSGSGSSNLTVGYEDCALSLQAGQKLLFDKLENITAERTTVQYGIVTMHNVMHLCIDCYIRIIVRVCSNESNPSFCFPPPPPHTHTHTQCCKA